jgi:hypothetical protein
MTRLTGYWIVTALLALWLALGGLLDLMQASPMRALMHALHYPDYMLLILGSCKLLAIPALVYSKLDRLTEWAYAGITFDTLGAFVSHCFVRDPVSVTIAPLLMLMLAAGSYWLRPEGSRADA